FQFIFVGGGTLLEELQLKSRERNNILFTGWLEKSDVIEYYKKADSLILPSHAEGFPNVILESLNYRLPIISTNVGAISESVIDGYNGFLIEVEDKNSLYDSILKLGSSNELRQKFSLNSEKILFENHSIENNCQKIFNIFNI
ncbi:MAG TPA: glycosyltransferase, partial [Arcobacter sp.]|nr:glycosyltransferase [Arcobacter sp.]